MGPESTDVRWQQRLNNFESALSQLKDGIDAQAARPLNPMETQGLIKAFEFTHELAWNVMKDYFADQGNTSISGSRDAFREAFSKGLIENGDISWLQSSNRSLGPHHGILLPGPHFQCETFGRYAVG